MTVLAAIRARTGLTVEELPGEEEGRLAFLAVQTGLVSADARLAVFDTGGGSSQFTFGRGGHVDEQFSVPVGAVQVHRALRSGQRVTTAVLDEARAAIAADLSSIDGRPTRPTPSSAMGGAVTNITAVKHGLAVYDPEVVQGTVLDRAEIDRQIELYRSPRRRRLAARSSASSRPAPRSSWPARCIVRTIMDKLGQDSLTVSDRGLRHGLLVDRFSS